MTKEALIAAPELERIAAGLSDEDREAFLRARVYPSGTWLRARCRHLYGDGLCRLTGELTTLGLALRTHLQQKGSDHAQG